MPVHVQVTCGVMRMCLGALQPAYVGLMATCNNDQVVVERLCQCVAYQLWCPGMSALQQHSCRGDWLLGTY
jgi:hypothetical protein